MPRMEVHKQVSKRGGVIGSLQRRVSSPPKDVGYPATRKDIPQEYRVRIKSSISNTDGSDVTVHAILQGKFPIRTTSEWQPFATAGLLYKEFQALAQMISGRALISRFGRRRMWVGTSPLTLTLPLKFEAVEDPEREVVLPCKMLQRMSLPSGGAVSGEKHWYDIFSMIPPGPNPFTVEFLEEIPSIYGKDVGGELLQLARKLPGVRGLGDIINIHIGTFLFIPRVIIKEVQVEFDSKFTKEGYPISASASLIFETFEIMTKESLDEHVYKVKEVQTSKLRSDVIDAGDIKTGIITKPGYPDTAYA
ncbi:MAG: hypothetical protein ACTSVF_01270 [Candidatus Asgardarchaeia archaeon]